MSEPYVVAEIEVGVVDLDLARAGRVAAVAPARTQVPVRARDLLGDPRDPYRPAVAAFVACGLPDGHPRWDDYAVHVTCRGGGWWTVTRLTRGVTAAGVEVHTSRDDSPETTPDRFMDVDTALRVAEEHARTVRTRQGTADDVLAADEHNPDRKP